MPNTRRRRFSAQNITRDQSKLQNATLSSLKASNLDKSTESNDAAKFTRPKNKTVPVNSINADNSLIIVEEYEISNTSLLTNSTEERQKESNTDKDVTASSCNINLFNILNVTNDSSTPSSETIKQRDTNEYQTKRESRQLNRERMLIRRDTYPGQHRVKIRSPKRPIMVPDCNMRVAEDKLYQRTTGTSPIDWGVEDEQNILLLGGANMGAGSNIIDEITRPSIRRLSFKSDLDDMCRICHGGEALSPELGPLISACACRGTVGRVHLKCLEHWLTESGKSRCELCGTRYVTQRVHRYGIARALVLWILSQNTKQLMVDSLGIILMSPLAVLAAWLSGRTLAGLMSEQNHVTPWPLASTFVLACMTLVCYYCWIVSAATRHALGWWIWYRSQYEVRLQFQGNEE